MAEWWLISKYLELPDIVNLAATCKFIRQIFVAPTGGICINLGDRVATCHKNKIIIMNGYIWMFEDFTPLLDDIGGVFVKVFVCKNCEICMCPIGRWNFQKFSLYRNERHAAEWAAFAAALVPVIWYVPGVYWTRETINYLLGIIATLVG